MSPFKSYMISSNAEKEFLLGRFLYRNSLIKRQEKQCMTSLGNSYTISKVRPLREGKLSLGTIKN